MECHVEILLWLSVQVLRCLGVQQNTDYYFCPGGSETLTCSTNYTFLEWNVSSFRQPETRSISYFDQNPVVQSIMMDSAKLIFSRVSSPGALPLVSTMTIMNITSNLEGTIITCTGLNSSLVSSVVLMTTIHVYVDFPNAPKVVPRPDVVYFGGDNFSAALEWSQYNDRETYSIAIVPEPLHTGRNTTTNVWMVLLYNTQYNVTVTTNLCGHSNATNFTIHYSECGSPTVGDETVTILSHMHTEGPWLEGNTISYSCASGLKIAGMNTSTCMDNGWWEPDPSDITCTAICGPPTPPLNGYIHSYSNKSLRVIVVCHEGNSVNCKELHIADCHPNGTWQPNPSDLCDSIASDETPSSPDIKHTTNSNVFTTTLISSVSSSTFFFVVGIICGQVTWLIKKAKSKPLKSDRNSPVYEVVQPLPSTAAENQQTPKEVDIQLNEAYGPL